MSATELAWVVEAATGITSSNGHRVAPSAGALYPIETYVAVSRVEGIEAGLYHVDVRTKGLREGARRLGGRRSHDRRPRPGLPEQRARRTHLDRTISTHPLEVPPAPLPIRLLGGRSHRPYASPRRRGGGLGACMVGAFFDGTVNSLLRVDGRQEAALGLVAVGPR